MISIKSDSIRFTKLEGGEDRTLIDTLYIPVCHMWEAATIPRFDINQRTEMQDQRDKYVFRLDTQISAGLFLTGYWGIRPSQEVAGPPRSDVLIGQMGGVSWREDRSRNGITNGVRPAKMSSDRGGHRKDARWAVSSKGLEQDQQATWGLRVTYTTTS
jgi:hypothetical protein